MAGISVFGYRRYAKPGKIYEQLGQPVAELVPQLVEEAGEARPGRLAQALRQSASASRNRPWTPRSRAVS